MKRENVLKFTSFLANLKLNKFDKEIRSAIISNSLIANRVTRDYETTVQEVRTRYSEGMDEEIAKLLNYRSELITNPERSFEIEQKIFEECSEALRAEAEIGEFIMRYCEEEIDEKFVKMDKDVFVDQCANADIDITVTTLELINDLFN